MKQKLVNVINMINMIINMDAVLHQFIQLLT